MVRRPSHNKYGRVCAESEDIRTAGTAKFELCRSLSNSRELFYDGKMGRGFENPMNYEEWSKSLEVARTLTSNFAGRDDVRTEEKSFGAGKEGNEVKQRQRSRRSDLDATLDVFVQRFMKCFSDLFVNFISLCSRCFCNDLCFPDGVWNW